MVGGCTDSPLSAAELAAKMPALAAEIDTPDDNARTRAVRKLDMRDPEVARIALPHLMALLKSRNAHVPQAAAYLISDAGTNAGPAVPALVEALGHADADVREEVAYALGRIGPPASAAVPALTRLLDDPSQYTRRSAAEALAKFGPQARQATPGLIRMLAEDWPNSEAAAWAIGSIGPEARDAIPHLMRAYAKAPQPGFLYALGSMGSLAKEAVPLMTLALADEYSEAALIGLGEIGPDAMSCVPAIKKFLSSPDSHVRDVTRSTPAKLGPGAVSALVEELHNADADRRAYAAMALATMGAAAEAALPALRAALGDTAHGGPEYSTDLYPQTVGEWSAMAIGQIANSQPGAMTATAPAISGLAQRLVAAMPKGWKLTGSRRTDAPPQRWSPDPALPKQAGEFISFEHETLQAVFPPGAAYLAVIIMPAEYVGHLYEVNVLQAGGARLEWQNDKALLFLQGGLPAAEDWKPVEDAFASLGFKRVSAEITPAAAAKASRPTTLPADDKNKSLPGSRASLLYALAPSRLSFAAVAEANNVPLVVPNRSGTAAVSQWFHFTETLVGDADTRFPYPMNYVFEPNDERPILKGQRVLLVVRRGDSGYHAVRILSDTPELREEVRKLARQARELESVSAGPSASSGPSARPATQPAGSALSAEMCATRDKLLVTAQTDLQTGLTKLAKDYPELAGGKPYVEMKPGKMHFHMTNFEVPYVIAGSPATEPAPPADHYTITVILVAPKQDAEAPYQMLLNPKTYGHLDLMSYREVTAADPNLEKALERLYAAAMAPLADLETRLATGATVAATHPALPAWGEQVEGFAIRLRAAEPVLRADGWPQFLVDFRNAAKRRVELVFAPEHLRLEIDGVVYHPGAIPLGAVDVIRMGAGQDRLGVLFWPATSCDWRDPQNKALTPIKPGKHKFRLTFAGIPAEYLPPGKKPEITSNLLEIEIPTASSRPIPSTRPGPSTQPNETPATRASAE